jgi:hypothetical protein
MEREKEAGIEFLKRTEEKKEQNRQRKASLQTFQSS